MEAALTRRQKDPHLRLVPLQPTSTAAKKPFRRGIVYEDIMSSGEVEAVIQVSNRIQADDMSRPSVVMSRL